MSDRFLKINDVMRRLKLSRSTVYSYIASGDLQIVKFGRATRIAVNELNRFIAERSSGCTKVRA